MKRFAYYIALLPLVALYACSHNDIDELDGAMGNGNITISASLDDLVITRAEDTQAERTVKHIDVFAVDADGNIDYYERNTTGNNSGAAVDGAGTLTLSAARRAKDGDNFVFTQDATYTFYLVANSTATEETMAALATLRDLEILVQDDTYEVASGSATKTKTLLHLTGTTAGGSDAPDTFLMDAVATDGTQTGFVVNPATGNLTNLELTAEFKRAAAKIIVNIKQGEDVEFSQGLVDGSPSQYDFYKLPSTTFTLPIDESLVGIKLVDTETVNINGETFKWDKDNNNQIQIIGYAYAHSWDNTNLTNETSLILNIPMMWNEDGSEDKSKESAAPNSWYKVPLSQQKMFERNKCYIVNIEVNAVGAANRSTAIELRDIEYRTLEWQSVGIDVGDSSNDPEFLVLNRDTVKIYNMNSDFSQLEFSSSSAIPNSFANENSLETEKNNIKTNGGIILVDAYYYNYLDEKVELSTTAGDKYDIYENILSEAEQDVLNGKINIESPFVGISEQEIFAKFGPAPVVPAQPTVPENPVPEEAEEATNPGTQSDYAEAMSQSEPSNPSDGDVYYTYRWNNNQFQRKTFTYEESFRGGEWNESNWSSNWNGRQQMLTDYNNAVAAWEAWEEWNAWNSLSQAEKDAAIAEYEADVASYNERLAYYNQQVAAKQAYDQQVAEFTEGKEEDSHSNAIRYLEFEVYNQTGQMAKFVVAQYPTLYITNEMGWYSYRSDFGGTTYEKKGNPNYSGVTWSNGGWSRAYRETGFFNSKVAVSTNDGYSIRYYYYNDNSTTVTTTTIASLNNPRMYHVHVTATSSKYTVGKPRLDSDGFTESSLENSKLVSPSFMIASQLGATMAPDGGVTQAKQHCKEYVEVTKDVVYDDWRLPTAAEIEIIASHQDTSDAMATVMTGGRYFCSYNVIDGQVVYYQTTGKSGTTTAVRCIRDAY